MSQLRLQMAVRKPKMPFRTATPWPKQESCTDAPLEKRQDAGELRP